MGLSSMPGRSLLLLLSLCGISAGFMQENCTNYMLQFERVFSVPGDVAMLNTTLVSPDVFDFSSVSYNITWYNSTTGQEMSDQRGRILTQGATLWFLNVTLDDGGEYVSILRTPSKCYMQATKLVVDPAAAECGRPRKAHQQLTKGVHDSLHCPLKDYLSILDSYNVLSTLKWYKACDLIVDEKDGYIFKSKTELMIKGVELHHQDAYTCTLTFTLNGTTGSVSETIIANVTDTYSLVPQVHEPANMVTKAHSGSSFTKRCLVFVPGVGRPFIDVLWLVKDSFIFNSHPSDRVYISEQRSWSQDGPKKGMWIEQKLMFSELWEEDFNLNYTCRVYSSRGHPEAYFTLVKADPNFMIPIGSVLGSVVVLFIVAVILYYTFKIDIVLWFRRAFPVFYTNTNLDGKLYDAYVAYPQPHGYGFSQKVEAFALHTLPQVLEKSCDYKLFIAGRDCLPGQAMVNSVEENIQASRRFLLLYTASTFSRKRHTSSTCSNNNNVSKSGNSSHQTESPTSETSFCLGLDDDGNVSPDTRQEYECVAAMHRALLERSLKVVLVELEEITPAQLALFPESVRHLRRKQGAVCWWKTNRTQPKWRTCLRGREEGEKGTVATQAAAAAAPSLSPSSRFWKEIRYHMPVRGKRTVYPERTALLNL